MQEKTKGMDDIEDRYESDDTAEYAAPNHYTDFLAGSVEKVEIMRQRFEAGEHLHHPYDCKQLVGDKQDSVAYSQNLYERERGPRSHRVGRTATLD